MKPLQNNFTTPEQSKRLLELGVPAWTANIMFDKNRRRYELIETEDESLAETQRTLFYNGGAIPHWSVGRLIEICIKCSTLELAQVVFDTTLYEVSCLTNIEWVINVLESAIKCEHIDFSKLEELL